MLRRPDAYPSRTYACCFRLCEPFLVDSVRHVLLVSFITSEPYCLSSPSSGVFLIWFDGDLHLDSPHIISGCESLHLLVSSARGSLFDDDWMRCLPWVLRNRHIDFHKWLDKFALLLAMEECFSCSTSCQHELSLELMILVILTGVKWNLKVVLIWIFSDD